MQTLLALSAFSFPGYLLFFLGCLFCFLFYISLNIHLAKYNIRDFTFSHPPC